MNRQQFLRLVDELLDLEEGTINGSEPLEALGWSSLSVIGFMALVDEHFGMALSPATIARCTSAKDLAALLGDRLCAPETA